MKYTLTHPTPTTAECAVELDAADLALVRPVSVQRLAKSLKVSGFRPGKVPARIAEKYLDPAALDSQVAEDAVNRFMIEILNKDDIRALDRPSVDIKSFEPKRALSFVATVEVLPEITLGDYKKLKLKKVTPKVSEADIDEIIDRMRRSMAEKVEVERVAKSEDEVWIDFDGVDKDGQEVEGASGKDYPLQLGSGTFIPGFEEGLIGKKTGDSFELPLTFPKDYHHAPLAGADVIFKTTVKKVNEIKLPEVDDEFAKKCGPFETAVELRADVQRELMAQQERRAQDEVKDDLIEQLVKGSTVPIPEVLLKDQTEALERDAVQNLVYQGQTLSQYLKRQNLTREEWHEKELKEAATRRVQVGLVLAELSKAENIDVSKEELDARLEEMISKTSNPSMKANMDTPDARRDLANRVLTEKTVDRLVELNTK